MSLDIKKTGYNMRIFYTIILIILVFLAASSGLTKIILRPQDVAFFAQYGFTNPILIAYGAIQLLGGVLLTLSKTRIIGVVLVATTFLISAVILIMAGNMPMAAITLIFVMLLGLIMKQSLDKAAQRHC